ncbi:MAG: D-alanyl-D-alanine carboxypeptidase/D-alanyl-D-alanine-endopeptidase [Pseudomonadota bacterium]
MRVSRRTLLAGGVASLATRAWADAPLSSLRPMARPPITVANLVKEAGLSGQTVVYVTDLADGSVLADVDARVVLPPASVTKAVTALYAIEALGTDFRFTTGVYTTAPVTDGILEGDIILAGGGNPNLVTDDLAALAQTLKETGLREVRGDFYVWDDALRNVDEIDSSQLDYIGYNPSVTGLNLNFNRVHFEWKRQDVDFVTTMDARSERYRPEVTTAKITVVDRPSPVFTYADVGDVDEWTVARRALNAEGSRWLPVRHPALYAGEVFATFARSHGIVLKAAQETATEPTGAPLAIHQSRTLNDLMRSMLRFSTNLTAEAAGLTATGAASGHRRGLRTSALHMARWADRRCGGITPYFVDHSGLGDQSRVSPADMVKLLSANGVRDALLPVLHTISVSDGNDGVINTPGVSVRAKTGTLNFVSTLAGYINTADNRSLAFAIFSADLNARAEGKRDGRENPPGARGWSRRARALQQRILRQLVT